LDPDPARRGLPGPALERRLREGERVSNTTSDLVQRLETAARGATLFHAARVLLGPKPELPPDGEPVTRWWSGTDPAVGWSAFLSAERIFEAREYERLSRWHQCCYYGDDGLLNEYTRLAAEACGLLPWHFVRMGDFHRGIPHLNRDIWTFFLYRLAVNDPIAFGLDVYGLPPYSDFAFPDLAALVAGTCTDTEREEKWLSIFRERFHQGTGCTPGFVYAGLRLDVFSASLLGVRYLSEHKDELYGSPEVLDALIGNGGATSASLDRRPEVVETQKDKKPRTRKRGQNEARDAWVYEQCFAGVKHVVIVEELKQMAKSTGWYELETPQSVQQAAVRYARRHGFPLPAPRKDVD
jgi:hypothetical protein